MSLKRLIVGSITKSATKKGLASALDSLTGPSANSSAKGKEKQNLTRKPGKK